MRVHAARVRLRRRPALPSMAAAERAGGPQLGGRPRRGGRGRPYRGVCARARASARPRERRDAPPGRSLPGLGSCQHRDQPVGRVVVVDRTVKRLLRVRRPCVVDGRTELAQWFRAQGPNRLVKVDWDQGATWNLGLSCCDPIFDLAGVTAASQDRALEAELRRAYEALSGEPVSDERWLLYQLAQLSSGRDARYESAPSVDVACARAMQRYFHAAYFDDVALSGDGPLCGIDLDGVLETEHLSFPALTPTSAGALRALLAHGY